MGRRSESPRRPTLSSDPEVAFRHLIERSNLPPDSTQGRLLLHYFGLLCRWGSQINLTASTDWHVLRPLFEEALWAAHMYPESPQHHLDIGSGSGFPMLPIRVLRPGMELDLVESRLKRAIFLETVVADLRLASVRVHNTRLAKFLESDPRSPSWSVVSWKGLRLSQRDVAALLSRIAPGTQIWMFHGKELPLESPQKTLRQLELYERLPCPQRNNNYLSIYKVRGE